MADSTAKTQTSGRPPKRNQEALKQMIRRLSDRERADVLVFLVGYYSTSASVFSDTREFWQNLNTAIEAAGPSTPPPNTDELLKLVQEKSERFNQLLAGPLHHPMIPFFVSRLQSALFAVAMSSPQAWQQLESHCRERELRDKSQDSECGGLVQ